MKKSLKNKHRKISEAHKKEGHKRRIVTLICTALALATCVAYEPLRHNDFISLDDEEYVIANQNVTQGITINSIIWAFTTPHSGNWHSLTWLSHMLDCWLFGLNPAGHHMTSLLLHVVNTLLLFSVFKKMTGALWPSAFVAAVFALHPLRVESVAWVAERKDVLSGFFWILTMLAYVRYAERPGIKRYLLVAISLCLGLLSKPILVTLPFVLILLDYWPLNRIQLTWTKKNRPDAKSGPDQALYQHVSWRRLLAEKVPVFILVAIACIITYSVQHAAGAAKLTEKLPLNFRLSNALVSYISYIGKTFYPSSLAVFYPLNAIPSWQPVVCCLILIVISVLIVISRRKYLIVGWLWYLGTLIPVIGLVQVGSQAMADRYTYLPSIGISIIIAWGVAELSSTWRYRKIGLSILAGLVLAALLICTRTQVQYWKDSSTLYKHAIDVTKNNYKMHTCYGIILLREKKLDEAERHFEHTVRIRPGYMAGLDYLAQTLLLQGNVHQAIGYFNAILNERTDWPDVYFNLGLAYSRLDMDNLAVANLNKCIQLDPNKTEGLNNLAWILATTNDRKLRNPAKAIVYSLKACELNPDNPSFLDTLAVAYAAVGNFSDAVKTIQRALDLAESANMQELAEEIRPRLELYKSEQPYREK